MKKKIRLREIWENQDDKWTCSCGYDDNYVNEGTCNGCHAQQPNPEQEVTVIVRYIIIAEEL